MRQILIGIVVFFVMYEVNAVSQIKKDARNNGALGKITLKVVDDQYNIVTNANITGYFSNELKGYKDYSGVTDTNGLFTISEVSDHEMSYRITKDGYYKTSDIYYFNKAGQECAERDKFAPWKIKWIPWNPTVTVILKKIRNPIPMKVREIKAVFPGLEKYYPFDLDVGDWVEPLGKGRKAHIYIYHYNNTIDTFTGEWVLKMKTAAPPTGLQIAEHDNYSEFRTMHLAPENNYTNFLEFVSERNAKEIFKNTKLEKNQYLIFKCQNSTNPPTYNYGKIYQPLRYGKFRNSGKYEIHFTYYYNPTPDDRNLEYAPKQNLIDYSDMRFPPHFKP